MKTQKTNWLSHIIRSRWANSFLRRRFNRGSSRRPERPRLISAEIDTLETRTLLTASPIGDQFPVNEAFAIEGAPPSVAVQETTGDFVVVWTSFEQPPVDGGIQVTDLSGLGVYAQLYNADGTAKTDAFLVNSVTQGDQTAPAVAMDANGNFVVAWESLSLSDDDPDGHGIYFKRFEVTENMGVTTVTPGDEFRANMTTAGDQELPAIGMRDNGDFVLAWQSFGQDNNDLTEDYGIYYQRYTLVDMSGVLVPTPLNSMDLLANTAIEEGDQIHATVAMSRGNGNFVIAWEGPSASTAEEEAGVDIFAHLYAADGNEILVGGNSGEFTVNTELAKDQVNPDAAMDVSGDFVIVWEIGGQPGSGSDIRGQYFDDMGNKNGAGELSINQNLPEGQRSPSVGMDGGGNFLVTWQSVHQDGFSWGVYGREYDSNSAAVTDEFLVNTRVNGPQTLPDVGINGDGNAVVVWLGLDATHTPAVQAQRYLVPTTDPGPTPKDPTEVGGELVLAYYAALEEAPPSAAMDAKRNFVVVWQSYEDVGDDSGLGVFGRRFDRNGNPLDVSFVVTETTLNNQSNPDVASDLDGNFVVVWQADDQDGDGHGVFGRFFAADGTPLTGEFQVNELLTMGDQGVPSVAMDKEGNFVVSWQGPDADGMGIYARRYDVTWTNGTVTLTPGTEFQVNAQETFDQFSPDVAMNADGQFVIAWVSDHLAATIPDIDSEKSIFVQWYDANGVSVGEEKLVHSLDPEYEAQESPAVAINRDGNFTVTWQSINQDGNTWGVYARQFNTDKDPLQAEFLVNQTTQGPQRYASIVMDEVGNFVISWQSNHQDESSWGVFSRQYSLDATPLTDEMIVNTFEQGPQILPVMAGTPEGDYGIFWIGSGVDPNAPPPDGMQPVVRVEGVHGRLYAQPHLYAASVAPGQPPHVLVYNALTNEQLFDLAPYPGFSGGVRVALGDVNRDGMTDIITAAGPGGGPHVRVFDGNTGLQLPGPIGSFMAYDSGLPGEAGSFTGGVFVAVADLNGDGYADIITGADAGGGPHVKAFSGADGSVLFSFMAYNAQPLTGFTGGVRVAAGDVTGDGVPDIITGAGPGGGPHVRVFDGATPVTHGGETADIGGEIGSYFAYYSLPLFTGGIFVSAGEFDGLPGMDIVTAAGTNGGPHIRVASPASFTGTNFFADFMAYDLSYLGGVSVATVDWNDDGNPDILTGQLQGPNAEARVFDGTDLTNFTPTPLASFTPLSDLNPPLEGGVYVAGTVATGIGLGSPLMAAQSVQDATPGAAPLSQDQLAGIVQAVLGRSELSGLSAQQLATLADAKLSIRDLPGNLLGLTRPGQIILDTNAAGYGWYIDPTPGLDEEFTQDADSAYRSIDPKISDQMDLLTVVSHELAHLLGAEDSNNAHSVALMAPTLEPGTRKLFDQQLLDELFANTELTETLLSN